LLFAVCYLLCRTCSAETAQELFKAGNALYAEGKFSDSAEKYQAAADAGLKNWVLDYNLGNAYYRTGQIGMAILHYERAFRMNSTQADVLYNLDLATNKVGESAMPAGALQALAWRLFYSLSVNTLSLLASALFMLLCAAGIFLLLSSPRVVSGDPSFAAWIDSRFRPQQETVPSIKYSGMGRGNDKWVLVAPFVFIACWLGTRIYLLEMSEGIVVASVAEVRSGPNTSYPANFTVPEGHKVLLLDEQEPVTGWLEVGVPDQGLKGWVPTSSVEHI
jgi:hypothetical protein